LIGFTLHGKPPPQNTLSPKDEKDERGKRDGGGVVRIILMEE
jgi:hypothetical protein